MDYDPTMNLDIFKNLTTYGNDYCKFKPDKRVLHTWPKGRKEPLQKQPPLSKPISLETFYKYHENAYIPFDRLLQPEPIVQSCPNVTFTIMKEPPDDGKEEAIKTRPRLLLAPALSMDDVSDPEMRKVICDYMYTSDWKKAAKEAAQPITEHPIPNTAFEIKNSVMLKTQIYDPLPLGLKEKGKEWDNLQARACVDPTLTFWTNKDPPVKCGACINSLRGLVKQEIKDEIADLIKRNKLRLPHDIAVSGYTGYMPRLSRGVPLVKADLPTTHPFLSTSEAIAQKFKTTNK